MDSSQYNPIYVQWNDPYSSHHPPAHTLPPPPPPPPQSHHPERPIFYGQSSQSGGQIHDYHLYSRHQNITLNPAVNMPSSYHSQHPPPPPSQHPPYIPQQVSHESSSNIPCTESRDITQSVWVGYKEKRHDSWPADSSQGRIHVGQNRGDADLDRNYQYDIIPSSRDSSGVSLSWGLDGTSRLRDEFRNLGYERKESGSPRIERNCQDRGQLKSESLRYPRGLDEGNMGLSSSVGYGSGRNDVTVSRDVEELLLWHNESGERVFRFDSLRYKMESSRQTLQRISDVDSTCSGPSGNGKGAKRPFIPKRLVIGNEEYVRVGNGNQLVRDPKKRARALANEKVRWSLHNVRLWLVKKKKYCQFFTRFGECIKDDGKCPYVHDPSKIAVCTKFLNGLCTNANCKLTHKVIPERMPDCSYFLQGLCNNETCPYRHVHVNPSAAICVGFLKGYCSDGDECRKKHSYTCPVFEATGSCPQGSKCKLHHPKNQRKGKKRKRGSEASQKNARGRYFGSLQKVLSDSEPTERSTDIEVFGMEGLDFINLGAAEYACNENDPGTEQTVSSESEAPVSIYNLIRRVALMHQ